MALAPYRPSLIGESLEKQIDRLFEEAVRTVSSATTTWIPSWNVYEDEHGCSVQVALPGMDSKEIEVLIEDGVLTVKGERKPLPEQGRSWLVHEIRSGTFGRSFTLPPYVDTEKASAQFKAGLLTVNFPKREEAKPRRIMIGE